MPQCQFPIFYYFCVSEKLHKKYSQNWMKQKPKFLFFPTRDRVQSRDGGDPGASQTMGWCSLAPSHATRWWGHLSHLLTPPFCLYILLCEKTLRPNQYSTKHTASHRRHQEGPEALPGTLPERGITTRGLLHHHACLRSDA
jgi:hypothetical protein